VLLLSLAAAITICLSIDHPLPD
jgi:hypothetical protein